MDMFNHLSKSNNTSLCIPSPRAVTPIQKPGCPKIHVETDPRQSPLRPRLSISTDYENSENGSSDNPGATTGGTLEYV